MDTWLDLLCDELAPGGVGGLVVARQDDVRAAVALVRRGAAWASPGAAPPLEVELAVGILALLLPPAPEPEVALHLVVRALGVASAAGPGCMVAIYEGVAALRQVDEPRLARRVLTRLALCAGIDAARGRRRDRLAAHRRAATWVRAR